jgi:restriction endonuclease S subunit
LRLKTFTIRASELGNRWDPSFHMLDKLSLPQGSRNLGQLANILRGTLIKSKHYVESKSKKDSPYIRISDMANGRLVDYGMKRVPRKLAKQQVETGDILLSVRGSIGKTALVTNAFEGAVPSSQVVIIRPCDPSVDREYLFRVLSSRTVQRQLDRFKTGTIISYVSLTDVKRIGIRVPSLEEQKRVVQKIEELERKHKGVFQELEEIQQRIDEVLDGESD